MKDTIPFAELVGTDKGKRHSDVSTIDLLRRRRTYACTVCIYTGVYMHVCMRMISGTGMPNLVHGPIIKSIPGEEMDRCCCCCCCGSGTEMIIIMAVTAHGEAESRSTKKSIDAT